MPTGVDFREPRESPCYPPPVRIRNLGFGLLVLLASCGGSGSPRRASSSSPAPPKPVICPLTGEEKPPEFPVSRPALGVKIDNAKPARPQAGVEFADIVYEELAEGGITRFLVMFHCNDAAELGPVRSARLVDADILREYAPVLFAYSGGNPIVKTKIEKTEGIVNLRFGAEPEGFTRKKGRSSPHNLFTTTDKLRALSDVEGSPKTQLVFSVVPPSTPASPSTATPSPSTPPGSAISFSYAGSATVRYSYDPASTTYLRFQGDTPHVSVTGAQMSATNVVVMKVKVVPGTITDSAGNFSPDITVIGTGEAVFLSKGIATNGKWSRPKESDRTSFLDAAGKPHRLAPGRTWIHLLPSDRPVTVT